MREDYNFSKAGRGKFYKADTKIHLPVYLDEDVQAALVSISNATGEDFSTLVNELLKKDFELIQVVR